MAPNKSRFSICATNVSLVAGRPAASRPRCRRVPSARDRSHPSGEFSIRTIRRAPAAASDPPTGNCADLRCGIGAGRRTQHAQRFRQILDSYLGAQDVLAQPRFDRADELARQHGEYFVRARCAAARVSRSRDPAGCAGPRAWMHRRRASRRRPKAGPAGSFAASARETRARPIPSGRARQIDAGDVCSSLFLKGFHMVGSGRFWQNSRPCRMPLPT